MLTYTVLKCLSVLCLTNVKWSQIGEVETKLELLKLELVLI